MICFMGGVGGEGHIARIRVGVGRGGVGDLQYETLVSLTCRYVLTTRSELETESDTMDAQKPMKARRASHTMRGCFGGSSSFSERKLY